MEATAESKLKVFVKDARILSDREITNLPEEKRKAVAESGDFGVWLEVDTSKAHITERENQLCVRIGEGGEKDRGIWLDLFCPEDRCVRKYSGIDLP